MRKWGLSCAHGSLARASVWPARAEAPGRGGVRGGGSAADPCLVVAQGGWGAPVVNPRWEKRASGPSFGFLSTPFPCSEMARLFLSLVAFSLGLCLPFIFLRGNVSTSSPGSAGGRLHGHRPCAASPWLPPSLLRARHVGLPLGGERLPCAEGLSLGPQRPCPPDATWL